MADLKSGFLVVKRFEFLYREFAEKPEFDSAIYALPLRGTGPERLRVQYRGLDRNALSPSQVGNLAEVRLWQMKGNRIESDAAVLGTDFLPSHEHALEVARRANEEANSAYEIVWTKLVEAEDSPPQGFVCLGFEPTYFDGDHFSAICDCMCFPRWHGTDPEGRLFRPYFDRLTADGLFQDGATAAEFLSHYLSFDWTERGEFKIASVWVPTR